MTSKPSKPHKPRWKPTRLRIVAGDLGGRKIEYNGDPATRPMKEKTREAVFSLLGGYLNNTFAIDLFAGTGVLGFESVSRGAVGCLLLDFSRPTIHCLHRNRQLLGLDDQVIIQCVDTLAWLRKSHLHLTDAPELPWVIFCCPPYSMWKTKTQPLVDGLKLLFSLAPTNSRIVCETDFHFDLDSFITDVSWDVRSYAPARIYIGNKASAGCHSDSEQG